MNHAERSLFLCTNGAPESLAALDYGVWLAELLRSRIVLLGAVERDGQAAAVEAALDATEARARQAGLSLERRTVSANLRETVCQLAEAEKHLVILGPLGRPWWRRWVQGRSFRRILQEIPAPLIYVPAPHCRLARILICTGGLRYTHSAERWARYLAQRTQAHLTWLHVVVPVTFDYPTAREVYEHRDRLLESDTPPARHLREALREAKEAGLEASVRVRTGDVVSEILAEVREGDYDLVVMGTPHSSHSLRRLYLPNVTAEVAESISVPVLTARLEPEPAAESAAPQG